MIAHDLRLFVQENMDLQTKLQELQQIKQSLLLQIDELERSIQQDRKVMSDIDEKLDVGAK